MTQSGHFSFLLHQRLNCFHARSYWFPVDRRNVVHNTSLMFLTPLYDNLLQINIQWLKSFCELIGGFCPPTWADDNSWKPHWAGGTTTRPLSDVLNPLESCMNYGRWRHWILISVKIRFRLRLVLNYAIWYSNAKGWIKIMFHCHLYIA